MKRSIDIRDNRMECPFCKERFTDNTILADHSVVCDMNPEVQSILNDLIGLTFRLKPGMMVKIVEVMPGQEKPIKVTVLTYRTESGDTFIATIQSVYVHYRDVCGKKFGVDSEFEDMAQKIREEIERSMI